MRLHQQAENLRQRSHSSSVPQDIAQSSHLRTANDTGKGGRNNSCFRQT